MRIAIIGTGGVGGYFGGRLAKAGYDVTFLARGEHKKKLQEHGLTVKSINGDFKVDRVQVVDEISKIGVCDLVFLCVKAWQVNLIAKELSAISHDDTYVLTLQNGVMTAEELQDYFSDDKIVRGLCRIISKIESPGVINHLAVEPTIIFGQPGNPKQESLQKIESILEESNIKARISEDITTDLWKKFLSICVSGLLAVTKTTYGELREIPETRELMIELFYEVYELSKKVGAKIEDDFIDRTVTFIDNFPYESTSSLTRDVWEGKPSELEYQNGTVVKLGEKYGVDTPVNRFIYYCIKPMEIKARRKL